MRNIKNIDIKKAVIHILDNNMDEPVLSEAELEINDDISEFLIRHIMKTSSDDEAKCAVFNEGRNVIKEIAEDTINRQDTFLENSREIAKYFFRSMKSNSNIPSGDLVICLFNCEYGITLGILKLDYNKTYIHSIDYKDDKMIISVLPQMIGLPGGGQKLQKCAFINFLQENYNLLVLDRQSSKDNESGIAAYLLNDLLNCIVLSDRRERTRTLLKTSEKWIRENLKEDADKAEKVRNVVSRTLKSDDVINIETMAHYAFDDHPELKEDYLNTLRDVGFEDREVPIDREWADKKLKRKRLKIDKDIEIYINSSVYEDSDRFEIKRNGDGTINIVIKHIRNYIEKQ
ncbi:nucleoid-associated protein [Fonticella tunisiensis]|uniref:Nucleoid associated protein NdpA n=1 Tax=Fonticella tunisiensis TaxID=1096341 RepID=A0A4R7KS41_9CLOT|nr:nucleoid-associated protein [Fonticella tunisiensis]TDT60902.1 nucleoid associated protein NdpA [Fonticella tunisiensis]